MNSNYLIPVAFVLYLFVLTMNIAEHVNEVDSNLQKMIQNNKQNEMLILPCVKGLIIQNGDGSTFEEEIIFDFPRAVKVYNERPAYSTTGIIDLIIQKSTQVCTQQNFGVKTK